MKVFDLRCEHGHSFEGWFGSEEDYSDQMASGLLECPLCASKAVNRRPSAPRLNLSGARAEAAPESAQAEATTPSVTPGAEPASPAAQALWLQAVQHLVANTEDVGRRFAEEARRIHYGETAQRNIRGQASRKEAEELGEEGIDVFSMPMPAALKGTVQ